jgi:hypothetical protein
MFTNAQRQVERTGRSGTPRDQYLQVSPVPGPSHFFLFPIDWCRRWTFTLQIRFLLINLFRLIACAQDLVAQFQNATDEGWCLPYTWFFYRPPCNPHPTAQSLCNSLAS